MQQTAAREGLTPQQLADRTAAQFEAMGEALNAPADDIVRTTQERHQPRRAGNLAAHGGARRHLSVEISGLVFGPRRGLFRRMRTDRGTGRQATRADRRAGRMGRGGELLSSGSRPIRTGCWRIIATIPISSRRKNIATKSSPSSKRGLNDLSISRSTFDWGVPVPGDPKPCDVCLGRRADQLHHRRPAFPIRSARAPNSGRPTPM